MAPLCRVLFWQARLDEVLERAATFSNQRRGVGLGATAGARPIDPLVRSGAGRKGDSDTWLRPATAPQPYAGNRGDRAMGGGHFGNAREGLDASLEAAHPRKGSGSSGSSSSHGHMSLMASTSPGDGRLAKDSWRRSVPPTQDADYARAKEAALRQAERLRHEVRAAP